MVFLKTLGTIVTCIIALFPLWISFGLYSAIDPQTGWQVFSVITTIIIYGSGAQLLFGLIELVVLVLIWE